MIGFNKPSSDETAYTNNSAITDCVNDIMDVSSSPSSSTAASPHWILSAKQQRQQQKEKGGFGPFVAFCFTVNYVVGTGFLTLPWAFAQGGIVLSSISLIVFGVVADMSKNYLLETMARAEDMLDPRMHWKNKNKDLESEKGRLVYSPMMLTPKQSSEMDQLLLRGDPEQYIGRGTIEYKSISNTTTNSNSSKLLALSETSTPVFSTQTTPRSMHTNKSKGGRILLRRAPPANLVKDRKFEVNTLCRIFLGKPGLRLYTLFISLYILSLLWAYTSVFASAMASVLPIVDREPSIGISDDDNYTIYAIVFGCIVVPLTCMELDEQIVIQVGMTLCRFLMVLLMLSTSQLCADEMRQMNSSNSNRDNEIEDKPVAMFRWSGIPQMLPIIVLSFMFHHSIPGLSQPVRDKRDLGSIFSSSILFSAVAYTLLGAVLAWTFGPSFIEQSSNLNWINFHRKSIISAGTSNMMTSDVDVNTLNDVIDGLDVSPSTATSSWSKAIALYIICFPAIDVLSAYPLNAITLGNNMFDAFYGSRIHEVQQNRWTKIPFRLLASIPPIVLGLFIRELGVISDYTGTTGFIIGLTIPGLLYIQSRRIAKEKNFSSSTYYSSYASYIPIAFFLALFGILIYVYVLIMLLSA